MSKENMFMTAAARRKEEQLALEEKLKNESSKANTNKKNATKKVTLNLSISPDAKNKLVAYANEKHISVSAIVAYWISEHC